MTPTEQFEVACIRVQHGTTITSIIKTVYGNKRRYREETTPKQRGELSRLRIEYLSQKTDTVRTRYPRLFIETTPERRKAVIDYCKANKMTIARFVNGAIAEALNRTKKD